MLISDLTRIIRVRIRQMFNLLQCSWENVFRKAKVFCFVLLRHPVLPGGDTLCYLDPGSGRHGKLQKHENERLHGFHPICSIWLVILPGSSRNIFFFVSWFTISSYWTTYSDTSLIYCQCILLSDLKTKHMLSFCFSDASVKLVDITIWLLFELTIFFAIFFNSMIFALIQTSACFHLI